MLGGRMVDEQARVPAGVVVAAVALGLMAFVGLLIAACSAFVMFVVNSPVIPRIPAVRVVAGSVDALILGLVILSGCTILGLLRLKIWARYSIVLLGLLDLLVFGLIAVGFLVVRVKWDLATMPVPTHPGLTLGNIMIWLAVFYAVLALVGIWWMIYFNVKHVRLTFADNQTRLTR